MNNNEERAGMIEHLQTFRSYAAIILFTALIGVPFYAQADDVNPQIANCEEMQDAATLAQMKNCSAHVGCNMILKLQNTCAKAKGFLDRLMESLSGRNEITNNDVFEANMPMLTQSDALISKVSAVRKIVRDSMNDPSWGKGTWKKFGGMDEYYEGGLKDGKYHGAGVSIRVNGAMTRGQMNNGNIEGQAHAVSIRDTMYVGNFYSMPRGNIVLQHEDGEVYTGVKINNGWSGVVEVTARNGDHYNSLYSTEGQFIARGPVAKAGQIAEMPSLPEPSALDDPKVAGGNSTGTSNSNPAVSNSNPSATNSNWQTARTCDGQCVLLVAETKCKHIRVNQENLSCLIQNGVGREDDTPEICAQAKSLTGCMTKAEKLAAKNSQEAATPKKYRYGSVCERNIEKVQNAVMEKNLPQTAASYDLFLKDIHWYRAKIAEPCTGSSAEAARAYKASMDEYNKISQYCAGAHPTYACMQWGAGGVGYANANQAHYAAFKAEVDKALSDPNYSADLGTVTGSGAVNAADAACAASLKNIENQYSAQHDIPKNSVVVLSEANMWRIAKSIEVIKAQCPQSERYKAEVASIQSSYGEIKRVCDASASNPPCKPRLPGKEPAPAAPQVATALPPLQKKPPASCESQSGANWKKCLQEACAKLEGTFSGNNCVSCEWAGGGWNRCPPGSGGVSSNQ